MPVGADDDRTLRVDVREKRHGDGRRVIAGMAFDVAPGEFVALVGPSGCGKSTLLNILAGLDDRFTGTVCLPPGRLGMVFQTPRLLPWRSVADNLLLVDPPGGAPAVATVLDAVGLGDRAGAWPNHLSLGMQRRVAVARAFAVEPSLLLMDEPFVSLDAATAASLRDLLRGLLKERPTSVVFVTHDLREAVELADRILFLAPSPTHVVREVAVGLPARSPDAVDALYRELARATPPSPACA